MDAPHIPEMPDPEEPEGPGGNILWTSGKVALFLAVVFGYFKFPFLNHSAREHASNGRVHAFTL
jgi:hypothetical protein